MPQRLPYDESCRALQREQIIEAGDIPPLPQQPPRHDDEVLGVNFFRTSLAEARLDNLTLPRTFFGRSEIRNTSFQNTDLSESTANWNDFIDVSFKSADLSRCDFRACLLEKVLFTEANLTEADFRYCGFKDCDFSGADMTSAKLTKKAGAALRLSSVQQNVIDWQVDDGDEPDGG
ncbi:MAG TPA: pentapeptide repeat-containing protein [Verrucomicrobiota bacterium]|nr:pentapeptide repeat-containing protein [Verrucomicrobiota bacterium]HNT15231.1 pentapeptide repeat-containing protein [Verrucomicrobiota bacterium]